MQILITGGAGFIGSSLVEKLLNEKHNVIVIDNFNNYYNPKLKEQNISDYLKNPYFKLYKHDICDSEFINNLFKSNKIDIVVHLAACAGVRNSLEFPLEYVNSNIYGTVNILESMKNNNIRKIIFASSSSVYGNCNAKKFSEDLKISQPISPYASTKSACEQFLYTYSKLYNINTICLRFFTVYGPRQRPDLAIRKFASKIQNNESISIYGDGNSARDYTYIDDIISGILGAIKYNKTPYEIINLGGGKSITINQMISAIENSLGKKAKINYLPMQPGDVNRTESDITKARKLLGYNPQTDFDEGIKKFIEWAKISKIFEKENI